MKIYADDLEVCTDCAMLIANGEGTDELAEKQREQWGDHAVHMVLAGDENEEGWFSWSSCDGCGSTLGGDRFKAAILTN